MKNAVKPQPRMVRLLDREPRASISTPPAKPSTDPPFKIEKGVPIPAMRNASRWIDQLPLDEMLVGDSLFLKDRKAIPQQIRNRAKQLKIEITVRALAGGVRLWRSA